MEKFEDLFNRELLKHVNLPDLLHKKEVEEKKCNPLMVVLAVIGAISAVAAIAYAVYYFFVPVYDDDFDDDDFDDDEFDD